MSTEEALIILGIAFAVGLLIGMQAGSTNMQRDAAFLASEKGIGLIISSRPSIPHGIRS